MNKNKNNKIIFILITIILIILVGDIIYIWQYENNSVINSFDDQNIISISHEENSNQYGDYIENITCNLENCEYIKSYDNYVLLKQNDHYYLYDYLSEKLLFGPFNFGESMDYYNSILTNDNDLIGIYYKDSNDFNFYVVESNKHFKTIEGTLWSNEINYNYNLLIDYGYFVIQNDDKNYFIKLEDGKVDYVIPNYINVIKEDKDNHIIYFGSYDSKLDKYTIYNNKGDILFNGDTVNDFEYINNQLILSYGDVFKVYDNNYNLIYTSTKYDDVKGIYNEYVVVIDNNYLKLVDLNDNIVTTFNKEWKDEKYIFYSAISGWYSENEIDKLYLIIENTEIPYGIKGNGIELYYVPETKETKIIETEGVGGYEKPVLYLYPTIKTNIVIGFENPSLLTTSYPKFKNNWKVTAYPNGDLYDKNGKYYYALYWEEDYNHSVDFTTGFYVEKENTIEFLEEKLSIIGLNDKERNEFIMYWLPILEKNEKNLVYFELTEERESYNKLIINPKPDSLLRVAIHVKKVYEKIPIKKQELTSFNRKGFIAIEWGGVIH